MRSVILFAFCAAACLAQPQVEGTTTNALTGQAIGGVHVHLRAARRIAGGTAVEKNFGAISAADGHFSMAAVPPADYELTAERNGYVAPDPSRLTVKAGESQKGVELKLMPSSSISGRVLDGEGEPAANLLVKAIRGSDAGADPTNDDGEFHIEDLRPGKYLLQAWHNGPGSQPEIRTDGTKEINYGATYYPGVLDLSAAVAVDVKAGAEVSGLEIRLMAQPILHISGRVTGATGSDTLIDGGSAGSTRGQKDGSFTLWRVPLGLHTVMAYSLGGNADRQSAPLEISVETSVDGVELALMAPFDVDFQIAGWSGGKGHLKMTPLSRPESDQVEGDMTADGSFRCHCPPAVYGVSIDSLPANTYIKSGLIDLRSDPHRLISIELGKPSATIAGTVTDSNGPVASALVALFPAGKHANELRVMVQAGVDGKYSITGLAPGKYAILALGALEPKALAQYDEKLETIDVSEGETAMRDLKVK
jgi:protocatechuate 3,4-dioxygenase beta subunit